LLGMVLARLFVTRAAVPPRFPPALLAVLAFALGIAALTQSGSLPDVLLHNGIMDPLCALLIYALAFNSGSLATFFGMPAIILLGEASYALYILHEPLWAWMTHGQPGLPAGHDVRTQTFVLVYIGVAIWISVLSV